MNKRQLHHLWTKVRIIKPIYFLVITVVMVFVSLFALRANNQHMLRLREAVYAADKNDGDTKTALANLQKYVTAHMNTKLTTGNASVYPPIQLQYTYDRLVQAQGSALQQANGQLYTEAQAYCEKQDPVDFSGHNRVPCIEQYVSGHGSSVTIAQIPASLYQFDFISPVWSPDFAGWCVVVTILAAFLGIFTWLVDLWFKKQVA